ncbi:hypothetical protein NFI96_006211 [Prochilodus magdalenae]|nr:hypothetical protein NFI96_006211 [Prochilodus magdalenae]
MQCSSAVLVTAMNGNTIQQTTSSVPPIAPHCGWWEFCELHASATARELAQQYRRFARTRPPHDVVTPESFGRQFTALFQQHFRSEVAKDAPPPPPPPMMTGRLRISSFSGALDYREPGGAALLAVLPSKADMVTVVREQEQPLRCSPNDTTNRALGHAPDEGEEPLSPRPDGTHFSHLRRSIRRLFKKRSPLEDPTNSGSGDESERRSVVSGTADRASPSPPQTPVAPAGGSNLLQRFRFSRLKRPQSTKRRQDSGGTCKEGQLKYLVVDDTISDTAPRWLRCRLLVRRTSDRFHLELYDPPKCDETESMFLSAWWLLEVRGFFSQVAEIWSSIYGIYNVWYL